MSRHHKTTHTIPSSSFPDHTSCAEDDGEKVAETERAKEQWELMCVKTALSALSV